MPNKPVVESLPFWPDIEVEFAEQLRNDLAHLHHGDYLAGAYPGTHSKLSSVNELLETLRQQLTVIWDAFMSDSFSLSASSQRSGLKTSGSDSNAAER
jgi:hypothetical protein